MPLLEKLRVFLQANQAEYTHSTHPTAFTAREVASAERLPAREVAKTVVVLGDDGYAMLVVPATKLVDFQEVRLELGFAHVRMATEYELGKLFPGTAKQAPCRRWAVCLYNLPVYLDSSLAAEDLIAFNAGTHRDEIHMRTAEFRRLVHPTVVSFARVEAAHGW